MSTYAVMGKMASVCHVVSAQDLGKSEQTLEKLVLWYRNALSLNNRNSAESISLLQFYPQNQMFYVC